MKMVKEEMGREAVILSTREVMDEDGLGSLVEITAGVGYHNNPPPPARNPYLKGQSPRAEARKKQALPAPKSDPPRRPTGPNVKGIECGLAEIKDLILDLTHRSSLSERLRDRQDLIKLYRGLIEVEVDPAIARSLVERAAAGNGSRDPEALIKHYLTGVLKTKKPLEGNFAPKPKLVSVVGASGVGKTTTIAKLAALWSVRKQKKLALIGLDSFRLGAAEQLKTYARIMGLPVRVVQDRDEFGQAVELFDDMDLILIDTAGRSFINQASRMELKEIFTRAGQVTTMLVLSAGAKDRDLADFIKRSKTLSADSLIISKIDETTTYGNIVNNLIKYKIPVSFLTNGQKVPDDIIPATPDRLADLIFTRGQGDENEYVPKESSRENQR
jgi:flagellar biosynthesis protein FlhF